MKFVQNKDFFSRVIGGEYVLLRQGDEYCFKLNESAGFLWENLKKNKSQEELIKLVSKKYSLDPTVANKDVSDFLKDGLKGGYLKKAN